MNVAPPVDLMEFDGIGGGSYLANESMNAERNCKL